MRYLDLNRLNTIDPAVFQAQEPSRKREFILFRRKELVGVPYRIEDAIEQSANEDNEDGR